MPTGLAAFREKYPQYNDMSDAKLGEALRQKHYSDMPEEEYWDKLGVENPHPIKTRAHEALEEVRHDFAAPRQPKTAQEWGSFTANAALPQVKAVQQIGDLANVGLSVVGGGAEHTVGALQHKFGTPAEVKLPGFLQNALNLTPVGPAVQQWNQWAKNPALARRQVGDVAEAVTPVPGVEAVEGLADAAKIGRVSREFNVSRKTAAAMIKAGTHDPGVLGGEFKPPRTRVEQTHQARVKRLEQQGVRFTPGIREGGYAKVHEERIRKESPLKGFGLHQAQQESLESFHRVALDKPLQPIRQSLGKGGPIGHEGVAEVRRRLSDFYDKTLGKALARQDATYMAEYKRLLGEANKLNADGRRLFINAINKEVRPRFLARSGTPARTMTGKQFKAAESALKAQARKLMGDGNDFHRQAGSLLREVAGALRDSIQRNSPTNVVGQLKRADQGWAALKRVEAAAAAATDRDGVFNTDQFLKAVKSTEQRGAGEAGKARVASGQALLQNFAQDAHGILKDVVRDPGTAAQRAFGTATKMLSGLIGGGLGHVARHVVPIPGVPEAVGYGIGHTIGGPIDRRIAEATNEAARLKQVTKMAGPKPATRGGISGAVETAGAVAPGVALERQRHREDAQARTQARRKQHQHQTGMVGQ